MRVLIVSTSERSGGAAVAASRLADALRSNGVKAHMLVRDKETADVNVTALPGQRRAQWHFLWERLRIWLRLRCRREHLFDIDTGYCGTDITRLPEFQHADIIHLHWVCQGMLSLTDIRRILDSGKPVVWTMHDIWPATSICHITLDCRRFEQQCCHCRLLPGGGSATDLAAQVWRRKQQLLADRRITFVTCSEWLRSEAASSALLSGQPIHTIPNPIDTNIYRPHDKSAARQRLGLPATGRIILFVSQRVTNAYKGMDYLVEACQNIAANQPGAADEVSVAIMGGHAEEVADRLPFRTFPLGYVNDTQRIVDAYSAADVFVLPSLSENLPNTIMEAMACGVPCVGFRVGGIPEEIDHMVNGYVADYRDSADLARGIDYVLFQADHAELSHNCLRKVASHYSTRAVSRRYVSIYEECLQHATDAAPDNQ